MPDPRFESALHPRDRDGRFVSTATRNRHANRAVNTATRDRLARHGWHHEPSTAGLVRSTMFRSGPIVDKIPERIQAWSGKRVRQETFDYFNNPDNHGRIIAAESALADGTVVAVGGIGIEHGETVHSFTVTNPDHRIEGHGAATLRERIRHCDFLGVGYTTEVADDNEASRALVESAGFVEIGREQRTRRSGHFTVIRYELGAF